MFDVLMNLIAGCVVGTAYTLFMFFPLIWWVIAKIFRIIGIIIRGIVRSIIFSIYWLCRLYLGRVDTIQKVPEYMIAPAPPPPVYMGYGPRPSGESFFDGSWSFGSKKTPTPFHEKKAPAFFYETKAPAFYEKKASAQTTWTPSVWPEQIPSFAERPQISSFAERPQIPSFYQRPQEAFRYPPHQTPAELYRKPQPEHPKVQERTAPKPDSRSHLVQASSSHPVPQHQDHQEHFDTRGDRGKGRHRHNNRMLPSNPPIKP